MSKAGELPFKGSWGRQAGALGLMVLGAGGMALGLEAAGALSPAAVRPVVHERVIPGPPVQSEVFRMAGELCVDGTAYGAVHGQVEPLPNSACNESSSTGPVAVIDGPSQAP
jgi:hypothetical protein